MEKILLLIIGLILFVYGILYLLIYANLILYGLSFGQYISFVGQRVECYSVFIGLFMMLTSKMIEV